MLDITQLCLGSGRPLLNVLALSQAPLTKSNHRHLGTKKELSPNARSFNKSFVYLAGSGNHYNNELQLGDHPLRQPATCSDSLWMKDYLFLDRKNDLPTDSYSTRPP